MRHLEKKNKPAKKTKKDQKKALRKAMKKAKRRRERNRDAEQIFFDETRRKGGTKAILEGLAKYGKTAREKLKKQ